MLVKLTDSVSEINYVSSPCKSIHLEKLFHFSSFLYVYLLMYSQWTSCARHCHRLNIFFYLPLWDKGFPGGSESKEPPAVPETWVWSLGWEDPLKKGMATHSSILAWTVPMDRGSWLATVHGIEKSRTQLSAAQHDISTNIMFK